MDKKVFSFIIENKLINTGERVGVAVSGGADSVVLLSILNKIKAELNLDLVVIHVNHNIRGDEAARDAEFVEKLSKELGLEFVLKSVNVLEYAAVNKKTIEQAARELRYAAIDDVVKSYSLDKVAVAHNLDDQAETVLMHLFRGSGLAGMEGMSPAMGYLVRPMLGCSKDEIESYAKCHGLKFVLDSTNAEEKYTRNYIRRVIIPSIEKVYSSAKQNICGFARKMKNTNLFVRSVVPDDMIEKNGEVVIVSANATALSNVLRTGLARRALELLNATVDVEEKHYNQIDSLYNSQVGKYIDLPHGIVVSKTYKGIRFARKCEFVFDEKDFLEDDEFDTSLGQIEVKISAVKGVGCDGLKIDPGKLPKGAKWRKIEAGDKFTKFSGGTKSASRYLIDKKIDATTRAQMVVLAKGNEILVIPGVEISQKLKIDQDTKRVVEICLKK